MTRQSLSCPGLSTALQDFCSDHHLPTDYLTMVKRWLAPIAETFAAQQKRQQTPLVVGICGAQGTGKSTLAELFKLLLTQRHRLDVAIISLDDYYLTHSVRQSLAAELHPLFATRGVPGTHDVSLGIEQLEALKSGQVPINVPMFNKATDDRDGARLVNTRPDIILFEGWCVGAGPYSENLDSPLNTLESVEDPDGLWRRAFVERLNTDYQQWFNLIDKLVFLKAPSFEAIVRWRAQQEQQLNASNLLPDRRMDLDKLRRFIAHYERLTIHLLTSIPSLANWVVALNEEHEVVDVR